MRTRITKLDSPNLNRSQYREALILYDLFEYGDFQTSSVARYLTFSQDTTNPVTLAQPDRGKGLLFSIFSRDITYNTVMLSFACTSGNETASLNMEPHALL